MPWTQAGCVYCKLFLCASEDWVFAVLVLAEVELHLQKEAQVPAHQLRGEGETALLESPTQYWVQNWT